MAGNLYVSPNVNFFNKLLIYGKLHDFSPDIPTFLQNLPTILDARMPGCRRNLDSAPKLKSNFNLKPKILYVADSVGHTASIRNLEQTSKSRVVTAKAYSLAYDVNARWRWPKLNFSEVVRIRVGTIMMS